MTRKRKYNSLTRDANLLVPLIFALATLALTWTTPIDSAVQRQFYEPAGQSPWPIAESHLSQVFYYGAPVIIGLIALFALYLVCFRRTHVSGSPSRKVGIYLLLCCLAGPGILINVILKEYTGRPRPRQIQQFGGDYDYHRPFELGKLAAGKSFPAGHASVGFLLSAFYFIYRKKSKITAKTFLSLSIGLGLLMGFFRIAAGAHFASDVIFAGILVFLINYGLTPVLKTDDSTLRKPARTDSSKQDEKRRFLTFAILAMLVTVPLLFAYPYHEETTKTVSLPETLESLTVVAERGDVEIAFTDRDNILIHGTYRGFGFPRKDIYIRFASGNDSSFEQTFTSEAIYIRSRGFFTDFEGKTRIEFPEDLNFELILLVKTGNLFLPVSSDRFHNENLLIRTDSDRIFYHTHSDP